MPLRAGSPSRPLTIGIDARAATEVKAGRGRVVRELLRGLAGAEDPHRYVCYARGAWDEPLGERFSWRLIGALTRAGTPLRRCALAASATCSWPPTPT